MYIHRPEPTLVHARLAALAAQKRELPYRPLNSFRRFLSKGPWLPAARVEARHCVQVALTELGAVQSEEC